MKKCEYCAKEISYHDMYCCEKCKESAEAYYTKRTRLQKIISVLNILGTCLIAVGIFVFAMQNFIGAMMMAVGGLAVGSVTLLLPCPTDNMIKKHKMEKAVKLVRIFGAFLLVFGCAALVLAFFRM
ncbi:MAG: hypothetical protein IJ298_03445 [Ruminococcus sp.]|nr:hypothetical protein [Ruminococcus sp.]